MVVGAFGLVLVGVGAWVFFADVPVSGWVRVVVWLAGGVAVHDGLLAPAAVTLGRLRRNRTPERFAPVIRFVGLAALTFALLAVPLFATGGIRR
jgi:hypothetical protein